MQMGATNGVTIQKGKRLVCHQYNKHTTNNQHKTKQLKKQIQYDNATQQTQHTCPRSPTSAIEVGVCGRGAVTKL